MTIIENKNILIFVKTNNRISVDIITLLKSLTRPIMHQLN